MAKLTELPPLHISDPIFWEGATTFLPRLNHKFLPSTTQSPANPAASQTEDSAEPPPATDADEPDDPRATPLF